MWNITLFSIFNLSVASNSGVVNWYDNASLQNLVGTGNSYITPIINTTTSYFVQSEYEFNIVNGGALDNTIGGGSYFNGNQSLIFDVYESCRVISAVVYADNPNTITFELRNDNSLVIQDTTITVVSGQQRIYFNFDVPVGSNYQLGIANNNSGLYRNNSGGIQESVLTAGEEFYEIDDMLVKLNKIIDNYFGFLEAHDNKKLMKRLKLADKELMKINDK